MFFSKRPGPVEWLVVGLGNRSITPDSLGPGVVDRTLVTRHILGAPYARGGMNPAAINDGFFPQNPTDIDIENFDFWSHLGGSEWVMLTFEETVELSRCKFYWFDDSRRGGGCALPQSWTLSYEDGGRFVPVEATESKMDEIAFKPVKTKRLRLDIRQRSRMASGLYEWLVY